MAKNTPADDAIATVERYNQVCMLLQKVIYDHDSMSVDCPVISQIIPEVDDYDPTRNTLSVGYFPHRGSRTERYIRVTREELEKIFNH